MSARRAILCVVLGAAVAALAGAGNKKDAPAAGKVRGTVVSKTESTLTVRAEGEPAARRYIIASPGAKFDAKTAAFFHDLPVGSEVELTLRPDRRNVVNVLFLAGPGKFGLLAGTVTGKSAASIDVKDDQGNTESYMPHWRIAPYQGLDKEMVEAIARRNIGDRVEVRWMVDDHRRVSTMRLLALSPQASTPPAGQGGTIVGDVVEKGKDWLEITSAESPAEHYLPQRIVGTKDELDKDVLRAIAKAKVGDRVEAMWFLDGERRLYSLKPATAAP
jgi:hypothetical protein